MHGVDVGGTAPEVERSPTDVRRTPRPGDPGAGEDASGHPAPAVARQVVPAPVVVRRPAPRLVRHPEVAVRAVIPIAVVVGAPRRRDAGRSPDVTVVADIRPVAVRVQFAVVRTYFSRQFRVCVGLEAIGGGIDFLAALDPAIEGVRGEGVERVGVGGQGSRDDFGSSSAADEDRTALAYDFGDATARGDEGRATRRDLDAKVAIVEKVDRGRRRVDTQLTVVG